MSNNPSISSNSKFGATVGLSTGAQMPVHVNADAVGNLLRTSDSGVSDGTSFIGGSAQLLTLPSAAYTTPAGGGYVFSTAGIRYVALDFTLTSFTGGTSPSITLILERLGGDTVYYPVYTSSAINSAGATSVDLGVGFGSGSGQQHAVFTGTARFRWTYAGSPTSATFSASIVGR